MSGRPFDAETDDGVLAVVVGDCGETAAMTSDRAWEVARAVAAGAHSSPNECAAFGRAVVWARHRRCFSEATGHLFSHVGLEDKERR